MLEAAIVIGALGIFAYAISASQSSTEEIIDNNSESIPSVDNSVNDNIPGGFTDMIDSESVLSKAAILIKGFEGFSAIPYKDDKAGTLAVEMSIGYGHQIKPGETLTEVTEEEAYQILQKDISSSWQCVKSRVTVDLNLNQAAALVSLCFNIGCSAFAGSTLLKSLNNDNYTDAAQEFEKWIYANRQISSDLVARRQVEKDLFEA